MSEDILTGSANALDREAAVAAALDVTTMSLRRWDASKKMKALGWPAPILLNGRRHRDRHAVQAFVRNCAAAQIKTA
jgi:hypothetical protein